jgi:hypothetical protein
MGLFGAYVAYSIGKRRGSKRAEREQNDYEQELCSVCHEIPLHIGACTYTGAVQDTCIRCCNCPEH